jgi:Mn2+/Fe2+ NRAMP family transporter
MTQPDSLALFYVIPIILWLVLVVILFRVWWSRKLEDSLAYLVFLRQRKVLFVTLFASLAALHVAEDSLQITNGFGWISDTMTVDIGVAGAVVGGIIIFLFGWLLLRGAATHVQRPIVLDVPAHLAYSLGVLDRSEQEQSERTVS